MKYQVDPFARYHEALEKVLGRPVWTHEFAFPEELRAEYLKQRPKPSFDDVLALLDDILARLSDKTVDEGGQAHEAR